jgi:MtrB/PioB family decaheme-associated outer membrane protein
LRTAALATACALLPIVGAQAQADNSFDVGAAPATTTEKSEALSVNEITLGIGAVTPSSPVFGRYNGMPSSGAGFMGGWNIQRRDAWDSGTTKFLSFTANDMNFGFGRIAPEASLNFKYGEQGKWSVFADYDATTYVANDHFMSILDKNGELSPGYQALLTAAGLYFTNAATPPPPAAKFGSFNASTHLATSNPVTVYGPGAQLTNTIGTRRDKGTVGASDEFGDWIVSAVYSHEHKDGSLEQAMTTGGNNAGMVTFPMPINYDTDNFVAAAAYSTSDFQAKFSYVFSNFVDNNSGGYAFQGWNFAAFKDTTVTPNAYTSYAKSGNYSLPPSNQAHTLKAEVGFNFDPTTRLYGTFVYGLQLQNDSLVAATQLGYVLTNPTLAAQLASNPKSLDGLVNTFFANITFTARPAPNWDFKASYTADARDAQTKAMFIYGNPTDTTALKFRQAVPESWLKQDFVAEAGYHFTPSTRITVGYAFRDAQRTNAITHRAIENEETVKLTSTFSPEWTGSLGFSHSDRTASAPDYSLWLVQISSDCGATLAQLGCQQVPFYEAARSANAVTGLLMGTINRTTNLSFYGKFSDDDYNLPTSPYNGVSVPSVGVYHNYSVQAGPDITRQIDPDTEIHLFYTFLRNYRGMRALNDQSNPTIPNVFYYTVKTTYDIHTVGMGGSWRANDKLKFGANYTFSYGGEHFNQSGSWDTAEAGQTFGGDPLLTNTSAIHQFTIHATYDYSPGTSFYLGYQFDSLSMSDWALVGPTVGQVLTGNIPPKYNVSTIRAAMTLRL